MRIIHETYYDVDRNAGTAKRFIEEAYADSSETKPTEDIVDGSKIMETDTGWLTMFNEKSGKWGNMFCIKEQ